MRKTLAIILALATAMTVQANQAVPSMLEHKVDTLTVTLLAFLTCSAIAMIFFIHRPKDPRLNQIVDKIDALSAKLASLEETLSTQNGSMNDHLLSQFDNVASALKHLEKKLPDKRDAVAYNAAVDAWIHINDHLCSMGKTRWKIQNVYRLLAGEPVDQQQLKQDMESLDEERREEVLGIVHDIERFKATHLTAINEWLAKEEGEIKTFADAVRQPIGKTFDEQLDEEVTGDEVPPGTTISKVAQLGYFFPSSRNGGYRKKAGILVSMLLMALLAPLTVHAQEIEVTTAEAKGIYKAVSKRRVSVHDPSVVWDSVNTPNRYYVIGSHRGLAYSTDMQNWTSGSETFAVVNANGSVSNVSTTGGAMETNLRKVFSTHRTTTITKGGEQVPFGNYDATDWCRAIPDDNGNWDINGVMWAPDMVWNPLMQKWCQYLSLNGNAWNSVIVLLTADKLTGPWVYEGPVVYSGFRSPTDQRVSWKKTDLELVIGEQSSLPSRYNHPSSANGQMWGDWWPNNIDPCVFYDEQGELWLAYGSWSGGIWMLRLNKVNGLRDYDVTYTSDYASKGKQCTSDPYFGKRIAGGCYVSGEGPYIEHIGQYYYLFMSYGGFAPDGGYEMRVFRSTNPDGPYKDASGRSAQFTNWVLNYGGSNADKRGMKIMGAYNQWGFQTVGECAQGHNSIIAAKDGRTYLVYHTKFNDGTYGHQVRVHQVFQNQQGWLVAAPFEYNGEQLTDADMAQPTPLDTADIVGTYDLLIHKYAMDHANMEEVTPVQIKLSADGRVTGKATGTWSIVDGTSYFNIVLGGVAYRGVLFEEVMDQHSLHAVSFTACATSGVNVWGYKRHPKWALAWQVNNQKLPTLYNNMQVKGDLALDGVWLGDENVTVQWTSSHPDIISEQGHYNAAGLTKETDVTLTLRVTSGNYFWQRQYTLKAQPDPNIDVIADVQRSASSSQSAYTLQGRRVSHLCRGLYIVDGKLKVVR